MVSKGIAKSCLCWGPLPMPGTPCIYPQEAPVRGKAAKLSKEKSPRHKAGHSTPAASAFVPSTMLTCTAKMAATGLWSLTVYSM